MTKGHSMAGWRVGFAVGNAEMVAALAKLKSYLDYGTFQPIQIASIIALNEGDGYVAEVNDIYTKRRDVLIDGLNRAGWKVEAPKGTMFVWAPIPDPYREMGSIDFTIDLLKRAKVAVSPGVGFGGSGEGFVRFALVENEHRISQAVRGIRKALDRL
jgi:alanine-synthesizing transaminase